MSDEFKNINDTGTEPDNRKERPVENQNEESYTKGESFVMKNSQERETDSQQQNMQEPQEAPSEENPYYARTYRKASEPRTENRSIEETADNTAKEPAGDKKNNYSSYQFATPASPEKKAKKKKNTSGAARKLGFAAACAAVFGLVAGVVFQGVNYVGDQLTPEETTQIAQAQLTNNSSTSSSDSSSQGNVAQVAANVMPSVVAITSISVQEIPNYYGYFFNYGGGTQAQETESSGSGIIVGQNDTELLIATNNHVVEGATSLSVCFTNQDGTAASSESDVENTSADSGSSTDLEGGTAVTAQVKGTDVDNDLAVVSVNLSDIPEDVRNEITIANLGSSDDLVVGEQVVAIGNALGYGQSVTSGYVSALNKQVSSDDVNGTFIQTDAAINPGNSGGALLNMNGEVVGINSSKIASDSVEGMGFAIPISRAEPILDELMSRETRQKVEDESQAAYLGITCINVTSNTQEMYNMPVGVFVNSVEEGGPAAEAGIQQGDIIQKFDGTTVQTYDNLTNQLSYYQAGEQVEVVIARAEGGQYEEQTVTVTLGARSDAQSSDQDSQSGQ